MATLSVTDLTFEARVLRAPGPVLVEFWKEGCGPCEAFKPALEQFAAQRPGVTVTTYEVVLGSMDHRRWKRYSVTGTPKLVLFNHGEVVWQALGGRSVAQLHDEVTQALDAPPSLGVA